MPENKKITILLVDDIPANLHTLEEMLQTDSRVFLKATSGAEALQLVLKNNDIGLILLDVQMPDMDGFEVAQHLQSYRATSLIPIIFVTAISKEEKFILKGFSKGAVDYLPKPLNIYITRSKVDVFERLYFYQQTLRDTIAEKEKVNKQLEQFTYIVSHDLKSPLTGIISLVELLKEDERINTVDGIKECLDLLSDASLRSVDMINSLLEDSKRADSRLSLELVDTAEMIRQLTRLLFNIKPVETILDPALPAFKTNKVKLKHVFHNLITNAIKHNDKEALKLRIGVNDRGDLYEFYVEDNGAGIADKDRKRIFELFETAAPSGGAETSTGVGLNIAKLYVEEQGGKIWVDSEPGKGSTFFFEWKKETLAHLNIREKQINASIN